MSRLEKLARGTTGIALWEGDNSPLGAKEDSC